MILSRYLLERVYLPTSSPGSFYGTDFKTLIAKTLEPAWRGNSISSDPLLASCIMEGIYLCVLQPATVSRPYPYFRFVHVPGRNWNLDTRMSSVLWHRGNEVFDSLACVLPGSRHTDFNKDNIPDLVGSAKKLAWMVVNMPPAWELLIRERKPA